MVLIVVISLTIVFGALYSSVLLKGSPFIQLPLDLGVRVTAMITDIAVK